LCFSRRGFRPAARPREEAEAEIHLIGTIGELSAEWMEFHHHHKSENLILAMDIETQSNELFCEKHQVATQAIDQFLDLLARLIAREHLRSHRAKGSKHSSKSDLDGDRTYG
jgi:hypothetical protein